MFALRLSVSRFSVSVVCLQGFIPSLYYITHLLLDSYRFKREVLPPLLTPETLETLKRFTFCIVYHSTPNGFQSFSTWPCASSFLSASFRISRIRSGPIKSAITSIGSSTKAFCQSMPSAANTFSVN